MSVPEASEKVSKHLPPSDKANKGCHLTSILPIWPLKMGLVINKKGFIRLFFFPRKVSTLQPNNKGQMIMEQM